MESRRREAVADSAESRKREAGCTKRRRRERQLEKSSIGENGDRSSTHEKIVSRAFTATILSFF